MALLQRSCHTSQIFPSQQENACILLTCTRTSDDASVLMHDTP